MNRIEIKGTALDATLQVDGHQMLATKAHLTLEAGGAPPVLVVALPVVHDDVSVYVDGSRVVLDEATHAALVAMGWTPPGEEG